jgi:hypothetical protein
MRGQHFLNGSPLCRIEEFACIGMSCSLLFGKNRLDSILPTLHVCDRRKFRRDGLAGSELTARIVLLAVNGLELPAAVPLIEVRPHLVIG